jgi:hypothetical protein
MVLVGTHELFCKSGMRINVVDVMELVFYRQKMTMTKARANNKTYSNDQRTWLTEAEIKRAKGHLCDYQYMRVDLRDGSFSIYDLRKNKADATVAPNR